MLKLPSGQFVNPSHVTTVRETAGGVDVLYRNGITETLRDADASLLRAYFDEQASWGEQGRSDTRRMLAEPARGE